MAANNTVKVAIVGDASSLEAAARKSNQALGDLEGTAKKVSGGGVSAFKDLAAGVGIGFGVENLLSFGTELFAVGQQAELYSSKAKTVFEGSAREVEQWAEANAAAMGMTTTEMQGAAAAVGDLLKPMGYTADQAADMSQELVGLSGALSAWSGGTRSAAEVSQILQKSLLGERDSLKELGISITEADVQARLAANGTSKLTGAALEQAKAQATLSMIFEKSTDAQRAWSDGTMDGVKSTNASKASLKELKEQIATALLPAFQELAKSLPEITESLQDLTPVLKTVGELSDNELVKFGNNLLKWVEPVHVVMKAVSGFTDTLRDLKDEFTDYEKSPGIAAAATKAFADELAKLPGRREEEKKAAQADLAVLHQDIKARVEHAEVTKVMAEQQKAATQVQENAERATQELTKALADQKRKNDDLYQSFLTAWSGQNIDLPKAIDDVRTSLLDYYDASKDAEEATKEHGAASEEAQRAQLKLNDAGRGGYEAIQKYAQVALETEAARRGIAVDALTATEKVSIQKDALNKLKDAVPEYTGAIDDVSKSMDGVATAMDTAAGKTEDAAKRIDTALAGLADKVAGHFSRISTSATSGLTMLTGTADRMEAVVSEIASYEKRNGPGWRT